MTMLENIEIGDRVINSLGEEATVTKVIKCEDGTFMLRIKPSITGWLTDEPHYSWCYTKDGEFVRNHWSEEASNLVKVIKHD